MYQDPDRHLNPPEVETFTGFVEFAANVNDCTVEVKATVNDDVLDVDSIQVWYCDAEISGILHSTQLDSLQAQFDADRENIISFDEVM